MVAAATKKAAKDPPQSGHGWKATTDRIIIGIPLDPCHSGYRRCCADSCNWEGNDDVQALMSPQEAREQTPEFPYADPWYHRGYRRYRGVRCVVCGAKVNAHEYMRQVLE